MAASLHKLTRKGNPDRVVWMLECQQAFDTVKAALIKQPILRAPDYEKLFCVATGASDSGLGAWLGQRRLQAGAQDGNCGESRGWSRSGQMLVPTALPGLGLYVLGRVRGAWTGQMDPGPGFREVTPEARSCPQH